VIGVLQAHEHLSQSEASVLGHVIEAFASY